MRKRRYEILLPLKHNDGRIVSPESFEQTREELVAQFESVSLEPHVIRGTWIHEGARYEDEVATQVAELLTPQSAYADVAVEYAQRAERRLTAQDPFGNIRIVDAHHIGTRPTEVHRMLSHSLRYDRGDRPTIDA